MGQAVSSQPLDLFEYLIPMPTFNAADYNLLQPDLDKIRHLRLYYDKEIKENFNFDLVNCEQFKEQMKQGCGYYYGRKMENNKREGLGIQIYEKEQNGITHIFGNFDNDKLKGEGLAIYSNDSYYYGEWEKSKCQGFGYFKNINGDFYLGKWNQGHFSEGYFRTANFEYYGQFNTSGQLDGIGRCYYFDGSIVEGDWKNDQLDGFIIHQFQNQDYYYGHCVDSLKQGVGIFNQKKQHQIYIGEFQLDQFHGLGSLISLNSNVTIHGQFKYGKPYGIYNEVALQGSYAQDYERIKWKTNDPQYHQQKAQDTTEKDKLKTNDPQNHQQNAQETTEKELQIQKEKLIQEFLHEQSQQTQNNVQKHYNDIQKMKTDKSKAIEKIIQDCYGYKQSYDTYEKRLSQLPCLHKLMDWYYHQNETNMPPHYREEWLRWLSSQYRSQIQQ